MVSPGLQAGAEAGSRYEILRVVNRGGMGEIALARVRGSKGFEKLVVLKRLRADAEREDHREMFDVEAELMSRIEHPNIVQVFDQPRIGGVQYLAMAYVRGRNLDQVIRRTRQTNARVNPAFTLSVMGEVLRGLAFVHRLKDDQGRALGVVHQDVTPSNILVSFFGEVKITDFGIAYVTSRDGGRRSGVLKGKPRYVAPEVLAGRRVNNRADIYGVGVVLYEMLAGRALFARPSIEDTLAAVARNELPDFKLVFPQLGDGVHRLLSRALAKDPQDRYRTAEEMHADLASELTRLSGPLSSARMGYLLRQWFTGDPDVPESDPTLDAALVEDASRTPTPVPAPSLDQTISELDRLLGGETSSADLFQLPPDVQSELDGLEDNEPFAALTPIPDLALAGPNGEELLLKSLTGIDSLRLNQPPMPPAAPMPALREPPSLSRGDGRALPSFPSGARSTPPQGYPAMSSTPVLGTRSSPGMLSPLAVSAPPGPFGSTSSPGGPFGATTPPGAPFATPSSPGMSAPMSAAQLYRTPPGGTPPPTITSPGMAPPMSRAMLGASSGGIAPPLAGHPETPLVRSAAGRARRAAAGAGEYTYAPGRLPEESNPPRSISSESQRPGALAGGSLADVPQRPTHDDVVIEESYDEVSAPSALQTEHTFWLGLALGIAIGVGGMLLLFSQKLF
ncbi:MAG: protein kinase [Deltaproteobacteria bacterium]|nr:protein kinase [Deltaproteobacteria bacterium]